MKKHYCLGHISHELIQVTPVSDFLWTYVMSNFQHAGDWGSIHPKVQVTLDPLIGTKASRNAKRRCL